MKIRSGTAAEAAELARRIPEFSNPYNLWEPGAPLPALDHVLIAAVEGEPVGFRGGSRHSADTFAVWLAAVLPEHRGRGIARALFEKQREWIESQGLRYLRTHVRSSNRRMLSILVEQGYHIVDVVSYSDPARNKVVFVKDLHPGAVQESDSLVIGLLQAADASKDDELQLWLRDRTISWLRFKYLGRIIESRDPNTILKAACAGGHRFCLILAAGAIISHAWKLGLAADIAAWAQGRMFLAAGHLPRSTTGGMTTPPALLVDLAEYQRRTMSDIAQLVSRHQPGGPDAGIVELPRAVSETLVNIAPANPEQAAVLSAVRGMALTTRALDVPPLSEQQSRFLSTVRRQLVHSRQGIFPWNFEAYDDVAVRPPNFPSPVSTIAGVAAGLKMNWILHTHGFDEHTRLVYFDYSDQALRFKQLLHAEWDGTDYPGFLKRLFRSIPAGEAFYQLWGGKTPDDIAWDAVAADWDREVDRWGGADQLRDQWRRIRPLRTAYVRCNVLDDPAPLLEQLDDSPRSIIWWSNVFFTYFSNWLYGIDERRRRFDAFLRKLTAMNPEIRLYGRDYQNMPIRALTAADYSRRYFQSVDDCLEPRAIGG